MGKNLNFTKDVFVDTVLVNDEVLVRKIKTLAYSCKLSIILNSYRKAANLRNIIKNLLAQNYNSFEIIIVDDLMTNEIENVFEEFTNCENINYIKKQLGSKSSAKNTALTYAKGDYLIFLEEEIEAIADNYLSVISEDISKNHSDIVLIKSNINGFNFLENTGLKFLSKEILTRRHLLDYTLASYALKKQFLNIYGLEFSTDILEKENLYFKIKIFNAAKQLSLVKNTNFYKKISRNNDNKVINEINIVRMLKTISKIEEFALDKKNCDYLQYLCGYLYLALLSQSNDSKEVESLKNIINRKKHYFKFDSLTKKLILNFSPKIFIKKFVVKESD